MTSQRTPTVTGRFSRLLRRSPTRPTTLTSYFEKLREAVSRTGASDERRGRSAATRGDAQASVRVLAVTTHRPEEVLNSVTGSEDETAVVTIDGANGTLGRGVEAVREVRRALRTHDPDVVLLDCHELLGFLTTVLCLADGVPVVPRLVGDTWRIFAEEGVRKARRERDYGRLLNYGLSLLLNRFTFSRAAGFVVVSEDLKEVTHRRTDCPRERIAVVPVPLTTDTAREGSADDARRALGVEEERVLLTVTNLAFEGKYEGVRQTIDEIRPLLAANPDTAYVVAGDGEYHADLRRYVRETVDDPAVRARIYTPGFVESVSDLYVLAEAFVYVSHLDGYPNAVLEAQTARLPVVANAAYGMREQIAHGETGLLVDASNDGAIGEAVGRLLADEDERERLGRNARACVLERNAPETVARQLREGLADIVSAVRSGN